MKIRMRLSSLLSPTLSPALLPACLAASLALAIVLAPWRCDGGAEPGNLAARVQLGALVLLALAAAFALLFRRLQGEDRIARLEAALCRERGARGQADEALAASDLLLGRLTGRADGLPLAADPLGQLGRIQAELLQVQLQSAAYDPMLAAQVELLCTRLERVARAVRAAATEPG